MKLPLVECFLISCWCVSTISSFSTQRTDAANDKETLDYQLLLTDNQRKRILENLERIASKSTERPNLHDKRKVFFLYINHKNSSSEDSDDSRSLDSWSIIWYIASFGGLIAFFLAVSCSEWCCRQRFNNNSNCTNDTTTAQPTTTRNSLLNAPPPPYDQFAPPSYESICLGRNRNGEKTEYDVYVVPVHMVGTIMEHQDEPPSYSNVNQSR